jgi:SAM-dependent methyltransferase
MPRVHGESMPPTQAMSMPCPGEELILRVAGSRDPAWFFESGRQSVRELERTLAIADRSLNSFESILDFGCGCGRMLLWMQELGRARAVQGTDIDADAVAWCREHLPYARVDINDAEPPLDYPDEAFDLVFSHSVFTHIDERRQDLWLTELQRVTRPGGFLVLSTQGEIALRQDAGATREPLERDGIVFVDRSQPPDFPLPDWYQTTFHAPWYIFEHWGQWFEIHGYVPGGALGLQDHVLLERRPGSNGSWVPVAARPSQAQATTLEQRVTEALATARASRATAAAAPSRLGAVGKLARRFALRAMRPYTAHEDRVDDAVAAAVGELSRVTARHAARLKALEKED